MLFNPKKNQYHISYTLQLLTLLNLLITNTLTQTPKLYITPSQQLLLFPHLYIDQTIFTQYQIQGTSITVHQALQKFQTYQQQLKIAKNYVDQPLIKMQHTFQDSIYFYYVSVESCIKYCKVKYRFIQEVFQACISWGSKIQGIQIIGQRDVIVWSNRTLGALKIHNSAQRITNQTYTFISVDIPSTFALKINKCHNFNTTMHICFTNQNIIQIHQIYDQQDQPQLQIAHILTPQQPLQCIINICRLEDDLVALCDCRKGCYNFRIVKNFLVQVIHQEMINMQQVKVMDMAQGGPKTVTMAVASQNILALMRWGQDQIAIVDSMLLPVLYRGQLSDIIVFGDNICLKYRVEANNNFAYQHIFIKYDQIRLQYDQLNIILDEPFVYAYYLYIFSISQTGHLSLRMTNHYYLLVEYQQKSRFVTIRAYNTGKQQDRYMQQLDNQTVNISIISAIQGQVYIHEQITAEIQINYQYSYPFELYNIFAGRISQFKFMQKQIPFQKQDNIQTQTNQVIIKNYQDLRILSINNLLQCIKLVNAGTAWVFTRYMTSQNNKIYVQQCKSQIAQSNSDFVCQIKQIINSFNGINKKLNIDKGKIENYGKQNIYKNNNSQWKLIQLQIKQNKLLYQIWQKKLTQTQQQIMINTQFHCHTFICHRMCFQTLSAGYIIVTTHNISTLTITLFNPASPTNTTVTQYNYPIYNYDDLTNFQISNIYSQVTSSNLVYVNYNIVLGFRLGTKRTIALILQMSLSKYLQQYGVRLALSQVMEFQFYVRFFRIYSHYLYSFNSTHVTKTSLITVNGRTLYSKMLEMKLGNQLQFVRNVGQYMLLVYVYSYRILDLSGELLGLVLDDRLFSSGQTGVRGLGNLGVYDMILFGANTLLLGVNNIMRAYDRSLSLTIGPYPMRDGRIRTHHQLSLSAISANISNPAATQYFNLTIDYQTSLVQIRGKAIKMLRYLPYSAINETVVIWQNMFTGPIYQYYIADIYDGAIIMLNHIQKIYDVGNQPQLPINRWISKNVTDQISKYQYRIMLKNYKNTVKNIYNINTHKNIYTNSSHFIIVSFQSKQIEEIFRIQNWVLYGQFVHYFQVSDRNGSCCGCRMVVMYNRDCVVYLKYGDKVEKQVKIFNLRDVYGVEIIQATLGGTNQQQKIYLILNQVVTQHTHNLDQQQSINSYQSSLYSIDFHLNEQNITQQNITQIKYFTIVNNILIYVESKQKIKNSTEDILQICTIKLSQLNKQPSICHNLLQIIPAYYYLSNVQLYYKLVTISDTLDKQNIRNMRILLLSKFSRAYHLDLTLKIKQFNDKILYADWLINNCYVSLNGYQSGNFIGAYVNGTEYDYFVLQYLELQDQGNRNNGSNKKIKDDDQRETILGFYRINDQFNRYCGNVGAWFQVRESEVASIVQITDEIFYPFIPHQSIMFTTLQVFHLYKNLTFVLNYDEPPSMQYAVINARNPSFYNKFYSKLLFEADPDQKYLWLYCWIGFACVGLILGGLKIISLMIDRGIIRWTKSLSQDDDSSGSPKVTIHYSSSHGMITEQNSYKSLSSR